MGIIAIPRILREKLSDDGAEALVDVINKAEENSRENVLVYVEEKFERRLSLETGKLDKRITEEVGKLRVELSEGLGMLRNEISKSRADMIKWMFIFTFGQFWAILSVIIVFFKK